MSEDGSEPGDSGGGAGVDLLAARLVDERRGGALRVAGLRAAGLDAAAFRVAGLRVVGRAVVAGREARLRTCLLSASRRFMARSRSA
jgi:hypothetical protein